MIVISGSSGAGKSCALKLLEDEGYYCVDNLPPRLLREFTREVDAHGEYKQFKGIAVCVDARATSLDLDTESESIKETLQKEGSLLLFLDAQPHVLLKRFSETRRRHPLAGPNNSLPEAIARERQHLEFIAAQADILIDTTDLSPSALRDTISSRIIDQRDGLSITIESFAFKKGVPTDADLVFDARALPNPYWVDELRNLSGKDEPIRQFLEADPRTAALFNRIRLFVFESLPDFDLSDRSYLTIAVGCTGGQHRSVYLAERLHQEILPLYRGARLRHRHLMEQGAA